jgi:hypothetical protein
MSCSSCKKKKEIVMTNPEPLEPIEFGPDVNDIKLAYAELTSFKGVQEDKKEFISKIYQSIFQEELDYSCGSCVSTQVRKFEHYITNVLNLTI